ncbi:MAG: SDR family NAD(P)-dependent oxidoreductase, partial [Woeseia sp.]
MCRIGYLVGLVVLIALTACSQPEEPAGITVTTPIVVVTGATGTQGGAVARELLARGYTVRALTRNPDQQAAADLRAAGAEVVQGNFDDDESLRAAMQGAYGVFAVTDFSEHGATRETEHGRALIYAAEDSHISHFVFSSVAS